MLYINTIAIFLISYCVFMLLLRLKDYRNKYGNRKYLVLLIFNCCAIVYLFLTIIIPTRADYNHARYILNTINLILCPISLVLYFWIFKHNRRKKLSGKEE